MPTLLFLFIDEIQESPKAIQLLRYFYEEKPDLYVIAAGSLLEFAMQKVPSFPVGRIDHLYLHPINFEEYLSAINNKNAVDTFNTIPIPAYAHNILMNLFHEYAIIGGMPEIVSQYAENKNIAQLSKYYNGLWQSYMDDVEKYAKNATEKNVIRHIIQTAPGELDRIKFEGFGNSNYRSREVGEALRSLSLGKIIQLVYPTTNLTPPLTPNLRKRPRLQFLDTGLLTNILLLQGDMITVEDLNDFYRGKIIHHLICQELISIHDEQKYIPHFWVREEKEGKEYGVIVLAEGLAEFLPSKQLEGVPRDDHGHISITQIQLGKMFAKLVGDEYAKQTGRERKVVGLQIGYEARCSKPHAFDVMLGSQLGVGGYRALAERGLNGVMVSVSGQLDLNYVPFEELVDPKTLVTVVRYVKPGCDFHSLARFLETFVNE